MSNPAITAAEVAPQSPGGIPKYQGTAQMGNPRMSAMNAQADDASKLAALVPSGGARRRRKYRGCQAITGHGTTTGQTTTTLPPGPAPIYKDPSAGTAYGAQNQTTGAMTTQLNLTEEAKYDNVAYAAPTGGSRRKKRGGVKWGCYSGGKLKSRRHSKKSSRKSRKSRRK
jgi:hypothetical protein